MWGLILKDIYTNKKTLIFSILGTLFFSIPFFISFGIGDVDTENGKSVETVISMMYMMLYFFIFMIWVDIILATISNDEKPTWINYIVSSPIAVKGQVQSKYCEGLIISSMYFSWCYMITQVSVAVNNFETSHIDLAMNLMFMLLFIYAIEIPFVVRFGSKHGNNIKFVFGMILVIAFLICFLYGEDFENTLYKLWDMLLNNKFNDKIIFLSSLFPYVVGVLYYVSYKISCKLYLKGAECFE
ncbi:MAG: ABC-2 transporter permease [Oscillospiraceae bacterium]